LPDWAPYTWPGLPYKLSLTFLTFTDHNASLLAQHNIVNQLQQAIKEKKKKRKKI
jgi:hypothetical protein